MSVVRERLFPYAALAFLLTALVYAPAVLSSFAPIDDQYYVLENAPLRRGLTEAMTERLARADPAKCLPRFLGYPPGKGVLGFPRCLFENPFPENPDFWLKGVDLSCASPWNDSSGALRAGTLISRRHIIFAKHFPLWKGVRILFVGSDGGVCPCYVEATRAVGDSDAMIGLLNAEVTPNIRPAKILPEDYAKYIGDGKGLPVATLTRNERAVLTELNGLPTNGAPARMWTILPKSELWRRYNEPIVTGDSGNPAFLIAGNEAILLYCLRSGGVGGGPWLHTRRREVQATMDALCPGYALEAFDFGKLGHGEGGGDSCGRR